MRLADPSEKIMHAELRIGRAPIMLADEFPEMGYRSPSTLGGSSVSDQFDGNRLGTLCNSFGHVWLLASKIEDVSPEEIQRRFEKMMGAGEA